MKKIQRERISMRGIVQFYFQTQGVVKSYLHRTGGDPLPQPAQFAQV